MCVTDCLMYIPPPTFATELYGILWTMEEC